jgi:hypothetical protein
MELQIYGLSSRSPPQEDIKIEGMPEKSKLQKITKRKGPVAWPLGRFLQESVQVRHYPPLFSE